MTDRASLFILPTPIVKSLAIYKKMYIISKMKGIYQGPPHYWHQYSLVPREQYYYSYYGMYGPHTDLSMYKSVGENVGHTQTIENYCGCNGSDGSNGFSLLTIILYIIFAWFLLRLLGVL